MKRANLTGIRMFVIIQVFTVLLVVITGFFALEFGSLDMNKSLKGDYFYTFIHSLKKKINIYNIKFNIKHNKRENIEL